jgi:prolyl-tRNA synthetase
VAQPAIGERLRETIAAMQKDLFTAAKNRLDENTVIASSLGEVEDILREVTAEKGGGKFVMAHVKDDPACDARLKEFKATVRNIPLTDAYDGAGKCIVTGETVDRRVVIAKSY